MGTTSTFDLPYPEGTDLVIQGDDAVQALAEAVDARINPNTASVGIAPAESAKSVGAATTVDFPGTKFMGGFSGVTELFTYAAGGTRFFLVSASVEVDVGSGGAASLSSTVYVRHNGVEIAGSIDEVSDSGGTLTMRKATHNISVPVNLADGDEIDVVAYAGGGTGSIGVTSLRIYPIGPAIP